MCYWYSQLKYLSQINEECVDDELLELIIARDVLHQTIGSLYFHKAFQHVLAASDKYTKDEIKRW